jgi:hypothetical protein
VSTALVIPLKTSGKPARKQKNYSVALMDWTETNIGVLNAKLFHMFDVYNGHVYVVVLENVKGITGQMVILHRKDVMYLELRINKFYKPKFSKLSWYQEDLLYLY